MKEQSKQTRQEIGRMGWEKHLQNGTNYQFTDQDRKIGTLNSLQSDKHHQFTTEDSAKGGLALREKYGVEFLKERSRKAHLAKEAKRLARKKALREMTYLGQ